MLKDLLDRAKRMAEETLPEDVLDAGRRLGRSVAAYAPAPLAEVIHYVTGEEEEAQPEPEPSGSAAEEAATGATATKADAPAEAEPQTVAPATPPPEAETTRPEPAPEPAPAEASVAQSPASPSASLREDPRAVLERVKAKAEHGLKPEDRLVVIYHDGGQDEDVAAIHQILEGVEAEVRENDLRREPQTARQLAELTGVMVPPYVFVNGKHWGSRYDLEALAADGDLEAVVANRLDEISDEARRIGHVHESYSDEISVANILTRWRLGHILCVDDLDSWYEVERGGAERFYYQGGPRPVEDMPTVAEEIVRGVEAEDFEAVWMLEPSVHLP